MTSFHGKPEGLGRDRASCPARRRGTLFLNGWSPGRFHLEHKIVHRQPRRFGHPFRHANGGQDTLDAPAGFFDPDPRKAVKLRMKPPDPSETVGQVELAGAVLAPILPPFPPERKVDAPGLEQAKHGQKQKPLPAQLGEPFLPPERVEKRFEPKALRVRRCKNQKPVDHMKMRAVSPLDPLLRRLFRLRRFLGRMLSRAFFIIRIHKKVTWLVIYEPRR